MNEPSKMKEKNIGKGKSIIINSVSVHDVGQRGRGPWL